MQGRNIFIIEDDQDIRESLQLALEMEGYEVLAAENGKEGIELLKKIQRPHLIILDLMMPIMDGWEFLSKRKLHQDLATIPVIVVSAAGDKTTPIEASSFIKKPIDLEAFLNVVEQYCD